MVNLNLKIFLIISLTSIWGFSTEEKQANPTLPAAPVKSKFYLKGRPLTELMKLAPMAKKQQIRNVVMARDGWADLYIIVYESTENDVILVYAIENPTLRNPDRPFDMFTIVSTITRYSVSPEHSLENKEFMQAIFEIPLKTVHKFLYKDLAPGAKQDTKLPH